MIVFKNYPLLKKGRLTLFTELTSQGLLHERTNYIILRNVFKKVVIAVLEVVSKEELCEAVEV